MHTTGGHGPFVLGDVRLRRTHQVLAEAGDVGVAAANQALRHDPRGMPGVAWNPR